MVDHVGVIRRHELTDQEWELLAPLRPRAATGRPRVSDRQVVNGMVYKIRTGISWRDLPERYGPWKTVYIRFRRYALTGVFTRALQQIQSRADAAGDIDWLVQITPPSSAPTSTPPTPAEKVPLWVRQGIELRLAGLTGSMAACRICCGMTSGTSSTLT
ncbi:transposase [Streptomyces sp. NPDC018610]|uniref:transposase n=1 Tax=Streptomyces sp. NPDC018610 TaxID=3365049 RepID=UPI0037A7208C